MWFICCCCCCFGYFVWDRKREVIFLIFLSISKEVKEWLDYCYMVGVFRFMLFWVLKCYLLRMRLMFFYFWWISWIWMILCFLWFFFVFFFGVFVFFLVIFCYFCGFFFLVLSSYVCFFYVWCFVVFCFW